MFLVLPVKNGTRIKFVFVFAVSSGIRMRRLERPEKQNKEITYDLLRWRIIKTPLGSGEGVSFPGRNKSENLFPIVHPARLLRAKPKPLFFCNSFIIALGNCSNSSLEQPGNSKCLAVIVGVTKERVPFPSKSSWHFNHLLDGSIKLIMIPIVTYFNGAANTT